MGNECLRCMKRPFNFNDPFMSQNFGPNHYVTDLDYLEDPQIVFRINNRPSISTKKDNRKSDRDLLLDDDHSSFGSSQSFNEDIHQPSQNKLFRELDPKCKPPPEDDRQQDASGSWVAIASGNSSENKPAKTSMMFMPDNLKKVHFPTANHSMEGEEVDGPEISRLMRRLWDKSANIATHCKQKVIEPKKVEKSDMENSHSNSSLSKIGQSVSQVQSYVKKDAFATGNNHDSHNSSSAVDSTFNHLDLDWDDEQGLEYGVQPYKFVGSANGFH